MFLLVVETARNAVSQKSVTDYGAILDILQDLVFLIGGKCCLGFLLLCSMIKMLLLACQQNLEYLSNIIKTGQ